VFYRKKEKLIIIFVGTRWVMKRMSVFALCFVALCLSNAYSAITIDYSHVKAADDTLTTPYSWATVDTFDSGRPGWNYTGNGGIRNGSVTGLYAAPYNSTHMSGPDATDYFSTPIDDTVLWSMVDFGGATYNYLGLFWGSVDEYNQIEFLNNGVVVANGTWTGTQVLSPSPANGNQTAPSTNLYVNFYGVPDFDAVRFTSFGDYGGTSPFAFEFDNLAVGIPAPGALMLGLVGLGAIRLRLRKIV
jgi:hypothetical protein